MFWIIFAGLKIVEVSAIIFVPALVGRFFNWLNGEGSDGFGEDWVCGFLFLLCLAAMLFLLVMVVVGLTQANISWTNSIIGAN